jgi:hypothetical protein
MKPKPKKGAEEKPEKLDEDNINVDNKALADRLFEEMKNREIVMLNQNRQETENMLIQIREELHSKHRPDSIKELESLKGLITEYINILKMIVNTVHEQAHFEDNFNLVIRNKEYNLEAIKSLESSVVVVKDRIKRREIEHLEKLPITFSPAYSKDQLRDLRKKLIEKDFIYSSITEADFVYIFTGQPILKGMKAIKWKKTKGSLRDLLTILMPGKTIHLDLVAKCFQDSTENPFKIGKPKLNARKHYSESYGRLKAIISSIS